VRYRTIVADPPWQYGSTQPGFTLGRVRGSRGVRRSAIPYPTLTIPEISALPVSDLAAEDAHLYLWTTNTHLRHGWDIVESWGFRYSTLLVWAKPPMGAAGFPAYPCHTEFVIFARRGRLPYVQRADRNWWAWSRSGHSAKPEAFLDLVEQVSPGPYLELFARRQRLGWDTWGDEALEHVSLEGAA
jgi:N6-adenosine-specific RNA methylase IME4